MSQNTKSLHLFYSYSELRNLIEEYITQQKAEFTFEGVYSFIAYWAMEDGMRSGNSKIIYESNKIQPDDQDRVRCVLDAFIRDGRIKVSCEAYYKA